MEGKCKHACLFRYCKKYQKKIELKQKKRDLNQVPDFVDQLSKAYNKAQIHQKMRNGFDHEKIVEVFNASELFNRDSISSAIENTEAG